jgi:hypothetical protein
MKKPVLCHEEITEDHKSNISLTLGDCRWQGMNAAYVLYRSFANP